MLDICRAMYSEKSRAFGRGLNDFCYVKQHSQVCNFADENTIYACGQNLDSVTSDIKSDMKYAISRYKNNEMFANPEKFQLIFIGLKDSITLCIDINGIVIQVTDSVKLLGVTIDSVFNFSQHVQSICKKTSNRTELFLELLQILNTKKILYYVILSFYPI